MSARTLARDVARSLLKRTNLSAMVRTRRLALEKRIYRKPIALADLRAAFAQIGISRGRVVWVQSSWNECYNVRGKPSEVLALLMDMVGPDGTLVMPAFPVDSDPSKILNIDTAPSSTGLLTELFRRQKGVERSIHLTTSVCALGPMAAHLTNAHHTELMPWGPNSPYWRLKECDALLVGIGNGRAIERLTPLHAVECLLYDELPFFGKVFGERIKYRWRRRSGETGEHVFLKRIGRIRTRGFGRHFPSDCYRELKLSNLVVYGADASRTLDHAIDLARRGTTIYIDPAPRAELFRPIVGGRRA